MAYTIDWHKNYVHIIFSEVNPLDEIIEVIGRIVGNNNYDKCKYQIVDLSKTTQILATSKDIPKLVALTKQADNWNANIKIVFISKAHQVTQFVKEYIAKMKENGITINFIDDFKDVYGLLK